MSLKVNNLFLKGNVKIPPSKSYAHRAIICAALSDGFSKIENIVLSDDINATINAVKALGADISINDDCISVYGIYRDHNNKADVNYKKDLISIDCMESGSTLRFMIPISTLFNTDKEFIMRGNLGKRPLDVYKRIFDINGIKYKNHTDENDNLTDRDDSYDRFVVSDGYIKPDRYIVPGNISSQFITGLLFTLPLIDGDSVLELEGKIESKGYIDITLQVLSDFGINIEKKNERTFLIKGNQKYKAGNYRVEGDFSQGTFFLCADALGSDIEIEDLNPDSIQGDKETLKILSDMGYEFKFSKDKEKTVFKCRGINNTNEELNLKGCIIDAAGCPDIIPVISVCAAVANGRTKIINAGRLRIKECDRLHAICSELSKLGAQISEGEDYIIIEGKEKLKGGCDVWSHKDHRICMMLAIASSICEEPVNIIDTECVSKSYPDFFDDFIKLGGEIHGEHMGKEY